MLPEPNRKSARELTRGDAYGLFISKTKEYSHLLEPPSPWFEQPRPQPQAISVRGAAGADPARKGPPRGCNRCWKPAAGAGWCCNHCAERRSRPCNRSDPEREVGPLRGERGLDDHPGSPGPDLHRLDRDARLGVSARLTGSVQRGCRSGPTTATRHRWPARFPARM
jgi:hypothetical protein